MEKESNIWIEVHLNWYLKDNIKMEKDGMRKIEEYNKKGDIIFEGEYLNGKRWKGKGKEYNDDDF